MFNFRTKLAPSPHQNNDTTHLYQDDDEYPNEADQDNGVYGAMPVVDNSMLIEPASTTKEVSLNFEGEDRDTCVFVPGLLGFDTLEITLPGSKRWIIADYWGDVKDIVEDPFISSPSPLGVSIFSKKKIKIKMKKKILNIYIYIYFFNFSTNVLFCYYNKYTVRS